MTEADAVKNQYYEEFIKDVARKNPHTTENALFLILIKEIQELRKEFVKLREEVEQL
jgi:hypothetical protein